MENAWGIFYANTMGMIIGGVLLIPGIALLTGHKGSSLRSIGGAVLAAIGGLILLSSFYFQGFRWLNVTAGVILVIFIGFTMMKKSPSNAVILVGLLVVIAATFSLSDTYPFNRFNFNGNVGSSVRDGTDQLFDILTGDGGDRGDRPRNREGHSSGRNG